jgi:glycosyl transferase family 61
LNRLLPITARLRARAFGSASFEACCSDRIELAPAVKREQPAAVALPGEIERASAVQEETTPEEEEKRLQEGERWHGPTIAYQIDDAVLADGCLYYGGGYDVFRNSARPILSREVDHLPEAQLCSNFVIERYFGHWIRDGLLLELLAKQRGIAGLRLSGRNWLHEPGYRELSGLRTAQTQHARIDRLWVVDDRGLNHNRIARFEEIRRRIRSVVKPAGAKRVFLSRGALGSTRELVNADAVHSALQRLGFEILHPERVSARHLVQSLADAEVAVLVEGSAQNHCLLAMPKGSTLVTIQPPERFNALSKPFADAIGIKWAFLVAEPRVGGFELEVGRLLTLLDLVEANSRHG